MRQLLYTTDIERYLFHSPDDMLNNYDIDEYFLQFLGNDLLEDISARLPGQELPPGADRQEIIERLSDGLAGHADILKPMWARIAADLRQSESYAADCRVAALLAFGAFLRTDLGLLRQKEDFFFLNKRSGACRQVCVSNEQDIVDALHDGNNEYIRIWSEDNDVPYFEAAVSSDKGYYIIPSCWMGRAVCSDIGYLLKKAGIREKGLV